MESKETFLEIGKNYAFRTVTMIYTGKLKNFNEKEFLVSDCAWIPETERWTDFVKYCAHREAELYTQDVVLSRGAMLDVTAIPFLITEQK